MSEQTPSQRISEKMLRIAGRELIFTGIMENGCPIGGVFTMAEEYRPDYVGWMRSIISYAIDKAVAQHTRNPNPGEFSWDTEHEAGIIRYERDLVWAEAVREAVGQGGKSYVVACRPWERPESVKTAVAEAVHAGVEKERYRIIHAVCPECASGTKLDDGFAFHVNCVPCKATKIWKMFPYLLEGYFPNGDPKQRQKVFAVTMARAKEPDRDFTDEEVRAIMEAANACT